MPTDQQTPIIVLQLSLFHPSGILRFQRDAIPREETGLEGVLERRLRDVLDRVSSMHALRPLTFMLGDTYYSYFVPFGERLCGLALTCHWTLNLEQHRSRCHQFVVRLGWVLMFFLGSTRQTFFSQLREKRRLVEIIVDMSIKGRRLNFEALDIDFIRRATPPSCSALCRPCDASLRLVIRDRWLYDASQRNNQSSYLHSEIIVNNPISNELQGHLSATFQPSRTRLNPILTVEEEGVRLPLGLYPLAQTNDQRYSSLVEVQLASEEQGHLLLFRVTNRAAFSIKYGRLVINLPESMAHCITRIDREPNTLSHKTSLKTRTGILHWRFDHLSPHQALECRLKLSRGMDVRAHPFPYRVTGKIKGPGEGEEVETLPIRQSFLHPKHPDRALHAIVDYDSSIIIQGDDVMR